MKNPLVSVIIPVYNTQKYLYDCLQSVVTQKYNELDIVIIDDGSTDSSQAICNKFAKKDSRIRVITQTNKGLSGARNTGIGYAKGEYILFLDSDDILLTDVLSSMVKQARDTDADISFFTWLEGTELNNIKYTFSVDEKVLSMDETMNLLYTNEYATYIAVSCCKLYRKELWNYVKFPEGRVHEDMATTHKVILQSKRVFFSNTPCLFYRTVQDSISKSGFNTKRLDLLYADYERYKDIKKYGSNKSLEKQSLEVIFYRSFEFANKSIKENLPECIAKLNADKYIMQSIMKDVVKAKFFKIRYKVSFWILSKNLLTGTAVYNTLLLFDETKNNILTAIAKVVKRGDNK